LAWRNRLSAIALVLVVLAAFRLLVPDLRSRSDALHLFVLSFGYGHLLGAAVFSLARRRSRRPSTSRAVALGFASTALLSLFTGSCLVLAAYPMLVLPLLVVSTWHVFENDLLLGSAYASGLRIGPLPRSLELHALAVGLTALVVAVFVASLEAPFPWLATGPLRPGVAASLCRGTAASVGLGLWLVRAPRLRLAGVVLVVLAVSIPRELSSWISAAEVFAGSSLYHLISWLIFFLDRARATARRSRPESRRLLVRLAAVHLPALLVGGAVALAAPEAGAGLRRWLFSPEIYLFWSLLHVVQTLAARGLEPDAPA
jgi:hypothetical protein